MYLRKVKRKCSIRGCKNTDCFSVSKSRESGNSVIICASCAKEIDLALEEVKKKPGFFVGGRKVRFDLKATQDAENDAINADIPESGNQTPDADEGADGEEKETPSASLGETDLDDGEDIDDTEPEDSKTAIADGEEAKKTSNRGRKADK